MDSKMIFPADCCCTLLKILCCLYKISLSFHTDGAIATAVYKNSIIFCLFSFVFGKYRLSAVV